VELTDFEKKVAEFCRSNALFPEDGGRVLVALSGGGDSVALLFVLVKIGGIFDLSVEAAHLNHSLRGEESLEDEWFVRDLCSRLGIRLSVESLPVEVFRAGRGSVETVAREERLAFLERAARNRGAMRIATGHTLDDQVETVLQRIIRGTGPSGLAGIPPKRDDLWVRPLLCVTRREIRDYLEGEGISFREDSTNTDTSFFRNRIRHELIPLLRERFSAGVTAGVARLAELSRIQEDYLETVTEEAFLDCRLLSNSYKILLDKEKFMIYHKMVRQRIVRHALEVLEGEGRDADMGEVERVLDGIVRGCDGIEVSSDVRCGVGGGVVALVRSSGPFGPISLKSPGETRIPYGWGRIVARKAGAGVKADGRKTVVLASSVMHRYGPLHVGSVMRGERMTPFGMRDSVKIRDIIAGSSLPRVLRDDVPVVRAGAVPVWIPGIRASELLRVDYGGTGVQRREEIYCLSYVDGIPGQPESPESIEVKRLKQGKQ